MVKEILFKKDRTGEIIKMNMTEVPYILDSVNWDAPEITMERYRVPFQVGSSLNGVIIGTRKPSFVGYVVANTNEEKYADVTIEEYYRMQDEDIRKNKTKLNSFFSVYDDVIIEVEGYTLTGRPTSPVKYSDNERENNEVMCRFSLEIECFKPLFSGESRTTNMNSYLKMFHFPGYIPEDEGFIFGEIKSGNIAYVENNGEVETGITIIIDAVSGSVVNPTIRKAYASEFISFEGLTISKGNTLKVTTGDGNENAIIHDVLSGNNVSVVGYVNVKSTFLKADIGQTIFTYESEEGTENNGTITIAITDSFFNIEGM